MNHMNMNGLNVTNVAGGGMPVMNNGTNGASSRVTSDQERETDYKARLNTYIYDYLLKNEQWDCARHLLKSSLAVNTSKASPGRRPNGVDEGSIDADSKDDIESKRPHDLPLPENVDAFENTSFLLEWFSLFWDMFWAQKGNKARSGQQAMQYIAHTQQQSRMRQEQQQAYLRQGPMMPNQLQYQQMMRGMQPGGGIPTAEQLRARANQQSQLRNNVTPQMLARNQLLQQQQQQQQQQQMERGGSDIDINGQRPRTPSSGDNAPSPSKRPRLEGPPFPQQMMSGGRVPPPGMQGQQMMNYNMNEASNMLLQNNINPSALSQDQMQMFTHSNPQARKKSMQLYANTMAQQHRNNMPQSGMPPQGSPVMQPGLDVQAGLDYYGNNNAAMRGLGGPGPNAGGNHALQDYQMQLMLLEQQNKKRLLMARQEQDSLRPEGQPGVMPGQQQPGFPPGMSPQGSRSGPSPNPSDQMKRGTPKMGQAGLPGSPMPDGNMPARGSPGPMNFNQMAPEMFNAMKGMGEGMAAGPNGSGMRPPSSHPQFNNGQMTQQQMEAMRAQGQNGRMPNGAAWQQGPQGQAPMMPQTSQGQQSQIGTPQQRNTMPPPQGLPAGGATNGRPASPAQTPAPPTPQQGNKPNPKGKKEGGDKQRKRPTKKGSVAAATPSAETENQPPTPTPQTPITPMHASSFNDKKANGQAQTTNSQAAAAVPAPAPVALPQQDNNGMGHFSDLGNGILDFDMEGPDVLTSFDFDSFLQDQDSQDFTLDASMAFANFDSVEAGAGDP